MTPPKSIIQLKIEAALVVDGGRINDEKRRERILAGAIQECSQVGFKSATMAGVARRASVSTATLYKEFKNKTNLVSASVAYIVPIVASAMTQTDNSENPLTRVTNMLITHGLTLGDPFMAWLYRAYTSTTDTGVTNPLTLIGRAGRTVTETFWKAQLLALQEEGHIRVSHHPTTINLLLGQIERRTILAQLLYGQNDRAQPSLAAAARFAARGLFANLGTPTFHQANWQNA